MPVEITVYNGRVIYVYEAPNHENRVFGPSIIRTLFPEERFTLLSYDRDWARIRYDNGKFGYVAFWQLMYGNNPTTKECYYHYSLSYACFTLYDVMPLGGW